jgi:hypothetical protein
MPQLAVHVVLDRSGSMASIKDDTIGGLNDYIKTLAKDSPDAKFYLTLFDSQSIDTTIHGRAASTIKPLTAEDFQPRGMTPLYDAIGQVVSLLEATEADNKALVIITDGQENRSREYTRDGIRDMLQEKQDKSNWLVQYLGANQDAFAEGGAIGTQSINTMNFAPSQIRKGFAASAGATLRYATSGDREAAAYTAEERASSIGAE